ncbi:MAG: SGNH/GDSL hydrolase family protein [Thermoguttaceae bacterium]
MNRTKSPSLHRRKGLPPDSLALALLIAGCCAARLAAAPPEKTARLLSEGAEPVTIVCLGDSITGVYYHTGGRRAYPEMLQVALERIYPKARLTVRNAGISGDTTRGALARLDRDVLAHRPQLVTIMFGMNDLVRGSADEFRKNLKEILTRCRQAGAEVLLCTQNSVVETPARPEAKLAEFTAAIRQVGQNEGVGLVDCYALYESVRAGSVLEWTLLHSDEIHPNMDGHKLFAEAIARSISGKDVSLKDAGPPQPALPHTRQLLAAGKPVKVLAMPPYDRWVGAAVTARHPQAQVAVSTWETAGRSLADLESDARKVRQMGVDLVILAVPASAASSSPEEFHKHFAWIMNWSLSFGVQEWDVLVAPPSTAKAELTPDERRWDELARRLIAAQDLTMITRPPGDTTPLLELLSPLF